MLNLPGTITLTNIATELTAPLRSPEEYAGNFLVQRRPDQPNSVRRGRYGQTSTRFPLKTPGFAGPYPLSILGEAAKRDRAVQWCICTVFISAT